MDEFNKSDAYYRSVGAEQGYRAGRSEGYDRGYTAGFVDGVKFAAFLAASAGGAYLWYKRHIEE